MRKVIPIIFRFCTIAFSILYNYVANLIHYWTVTNYNLSAEYLVKIGFIILTATFLGLSIIIFPLNNRTGKLITAILLFLGLVIGFILIHLIGMPFLVVFVCSVFATELLCRRKLFVNKKQ